jgi:hypothetical protein
LKFMNSVRHFFWCFAKFFSYKNFHFSPDLFYWIEIRRFWWWCYPFNPISSYKIFKNFINVASPSPSIISTQNNLTSQSLKRKASFNVDNSDSDESACVGTVKDFTRYFINQFEDEFKI